MDKSITCQTLQGTFTIAIDAKCYNVGLFMSGGADSAILAYLLALYSKQVSEINLIPIVVPLIDKGYQIEHVGKILTYINNKLGVKLVPLYGEPVEDIDTHDAREVLKYWLANKKLIDCIFNGVTRNPPADVREHLGHPVDNRRNYTDWVGEQYTFGTKDCISYMPLINFDKRVVIELYHKFDVIDLLPLTRSCYYAGRTDHQNVYGTCYRCSERQWAMENWNER